VPIAIVLAPPVAAEARKKAMHGVSAVLTRYYANAGDTWVIVREDDPEMVMQNGVLKIDDLRAKHLIP
jgi:hypothetical protein